MTAALSLLVGAITIGWLAPAWLGKLDVRRVDPIVLLAAWWSAALSVLGTAAAGTILLLLPDHGPGTGILSTLSGCWAAIAHGTTPRVEEIVGVFGAALVVAAMARLTMVAIRRVHRRARTRREHLALLRLGARREGESPTTLWLDHDQPLAFSVGGRPGVIVATEGLRRHLRPAEVTAVLVHERAHLRGFHHVLVAAATSLAETLPVVPLVRRLPVAVRTLVELAADVAAVRVCGADAVRSALARVRGSGTPDGALAMAGDAVDLRLARLSRVTAPAGRMRRMMTTGLAAVGALALPALAGTSLMLMIAMVACPFTG